MERYQTNILKEYVDKTELLIIDVDLRVRLSKELLEKYNQGLYTNGLAQMLEHIKQIKELGIKYPANANPIFYVYIVPDNNFRELLNFPSYRNYNGGGKPVSSYDLDGFNTAYGVSNNLLENKKELSIMRVVNSIHEFAHLVHGMFFNKDRLLSEGFAEALPLYTMDYESVFDEHREMLKTITEKQILSAQRLIELADNSNFNNGSIIPNKSCSFDFSYISSYLFVRGCLETIASKFNVDRVQATQRFLEIVKQSQCTHQWLIYDIANAIGIPQEELLNSKKMQINIIQNL
jgi:hypothetical protein